MSDECWCAECDETRRKAALDAGGSFSAYISRFMILCPDCGNKRCPRATHHDYACTGSNEPNQPGSAYVFPVLTEEAKARRLAELTAPVPLAEGVQPE